MANEQKIAKKNWTSNFTLIGRPVVTDFTFKIDERSSKSDWIYNSMSLGIDCGEKFGTVYAEMMGGYGAERDNNVIYAHGKDADGNDDFDTKLEIHWDDRLEESVLEQVGELCFITVGLEKTSTGKTFYKRFLSEYDAIAYIQEHLTSDMVVNVRGTLKYSLYNDVTQVRKVINSIVLSKIDDPAKFDARFTQSVLIDKDSASLKSVDKDKGVMYVDAKVLDYMKEYNGVEIRGNFPYDVQLEFEMDLTNPDRCKKVMDKLFKVKKGVTQINFDGHFIEGGATVTATIDDVPDDIKELIDLGLCTEEDVIAKCSANGSRERRMVLGAPHIKMVGDGENKTPVIQKFDEQYDEDELLLPCMFASESEDDDEPPFSADNTMTQTQNNELDWLDTL